MSVSEDPNDRTALQRPKALRGFRDIVLPGERAAVRGRGVRAPDQTPVGVASDVELRNTMRAERPSQSSTSRSTTGQGKSTRGKTRQ